MSIRKAQAEWKGELIHGSGRLAVGSGALDLPYSFKARFEDGQPDTNPGDGCAGNPPVTWCSTGQGWRIRLFTA